MTVPSESPVTEPGTARPAAPPRRLALSPSRAEDFKTCPLLYRFRAIDRIPEAPSRAAVRGTLVHLVLQELFARPARERTLQAGLESVGPLWDRLASEPSVRSLVPAGDDQAWVMDAARFVRAYFDLEDPAGVDHFACEHPVAAEGVPGVPLKGFIDRVDVAASGEVRIVDYKTGRSPGVTHETNRLYQLKFYALALFRRDGVVPTELTLLYLGDGVRLRYRPDLDELLRFERGVAALWTTITAAVESGDFPARPSGACRFCRHQARCPEFGGSTPPYVRPDQSSGGESVTTAAG